MPVTITINDTTPEAIKYLEYTRTLPFAKVESTKSTKSTKKSVLAKPKRVLTPKEEEFKENLLRALKQADDVRAGKLKAKPLDELLNEL